MWKCYRCGNWMPDTSIIKHLSKCQNWRNKFRTDSRIEIDGMTVLEPANPSTWEVNPVNTIAVAKPNDSRPPDCIKLYYELIREVN